MALLVVIACAEASASAMPLARADFWGHRALAERAGDGASRSRAAFDSGSGASSRSLRSEYFQHQVRETTRATIPALEALGAFCDGAFADAVLRQARANVGAWRERLATARALAAREKRTSPAYVDVACGFGMIAAYAASRQSVSRGKIQHIERHGVGPGFGPASLAQAAAPYENVYQIFSAVLAARAAAVSACLALVTPRARRLLPEAVRERFMYLMCLAQVSARFFFTHHRYALSATALSLERAAGAPLGSIAERIGEEPLFRRMSFVGGNRTRIMKGPEVVPCVTSLFYYFGITRLSPREHLLFHTLATLVRFAQDESVTRGDNTLVPHMYISVVMWKWQVWRAVAAFVVIVCATDWRHARQIFPRVLLRRVAATLFPGRERPADPPGDLETDDSTAWRDGIFSSVLCGN